MDDWAEGEGSPAANRVRGPAIGLLVTAIVGGAWALISVFSHLLGMAVPYQEYAGSEELPEWFAFAVGTVAGFVALAMAGLLAFAAMRMLRLRSYNLALVGSIIAMIPCVSPCCLLGLPLGIWSLVVLLDANVKRAFH